MTVYSRFMYRPRVAPVYRWLRVMDSSTRTCPASTVMPWTRWTVAAYPSSTHSATYAAGSRTLALVSRWVTLRDPPDWTPEHAAEAGLRLLAQSGLDEIPHHASA